ncbi:MAG: hypothetical protein JRI68_01250 [Deltaproteobacteria bacterium]|nr:hypothetical protein [Deltaproteobacteria bacterium]
MIDPKPFVDKAEAECGQTVLAQGEARLRSEHQLGETGLLCAVEDGLLFVEEDVLDPGEVTRIPAAEVRVARLDEGFLDFNLIVDTGEMVFHFEGMKEELAAAILERSGLPQRLTDTGASERGLAPADLAATGAPELVDFGADPFDVADHQAPPAPPTAAMRPQSVITGAAGGGAAPGPLPSPTTNQGSAGRVVIGMLVAAVLVVGLWAASLESTSDTAGASTQLTIQVVHNGSPVRQVDVYLQGTKVCTASPCVLSPGPGIWGVHAETRDGRIGKTTIELDMDSVMAVTLPLVAPVALAPSAAAGEPAALRLLTPQTDVHVFIDGVHRGKLPLVIPMLKPGTVELRFERGGSGQVLVKRVELLPGKAHTVSVEIPGEAPVDAGASAATAVPTEESPALLNCNSIPPSTVFVDGRQVGRTPRMGVVVQPGRHIVMFVHDTLGRKTRSVAAQAGQTVTVMARFAPPPAPTPPPATATGAPPGASADADYDYP